MTVRSKDEKENGLITLTCLSYIIVLKKREEGRLEAAQMKFLRHLLGITKLVKERNQCIRGKKREHRT